MGLETHMDTNMHLRRCTRACATREIHSTTLDCWCGCGSGCFCCSKRALLPHTVVVAEGEQRRILGLRMVRVLTATMFALFLLAMVYRFEGIGTPLRSLELGEHGLGPATRLMEWFPSPVPRKYLQAFDWALQHTSRPAYFHGEFSQRAVISSLFSAVAAHETAPVVACPRAYGNNRISVPEEP